MKNIGRFEPLCELVKIFKQKKVVVHCIFV